MAACELCGNLIASYKCPTCRIRYCSINCFKTHKSDICNPPISEPIETNLQNIETSYKYPTEDTVQMEKLINLRDNKDVKNCLNNPHVRKIMEGILEAADPTEAIAQAMTEPIFTELADACLRVVEPIDET